MTILIYWAAASSVLILAVVLVRALLGGRMGAGLRYALWGLVLLRLLIPVQLFDLPVPQPVREALGHHQTQTIDPAPVYPPAGDEAPGAVVLTPAGQSSGAAREDTPPANHDTPNSPAVPAFRPFDWRGALGWLWLGGAAAMGLALVLCNARFAAGLRRRRRPAGQEEGIPVYVAEGLESPCLFGVVRPAVYLTPEAAQNPTMLRHVLAHETTHARHGDQVWSLLRCAALAIHWWNPLVWLAAFLSRRDGELACDEGAIKLLGDGERKAYGWTLLTLVTAQPSPVSLMNAATTMSGGKKALWERVQRIAHAPKKAVWAAALAVVLALAVTACAFSSAAAPGEGPVEDPGPVTSQRPEPTVSASQEPAVLGGGESAAQPLTARQALYRAIVQKEDIKFVYPNAVVTASVDDLRAITVDYKVSPEKFTVLDMNGDGAEEVALWVDAGGWWTVVLCYEGGEVRGGCYYGRQFSPDDLKIDGTSYLSDGVGRRGVERIRFPLSGGGFGLEDVLYEEPLEGGEYTDKVYTMNGKEVAKAEYEAAWAAWEAQPNAVWYDFTQENLDALLGGTDSAEPTPTLTLTLTLTPTPAPAPAAQVMPFTGSLNLEFTSGAGAWRTVLTLNRDGTFTGEFSDTDMGVPEEGYYSTQYICTFHGRFGDVEQVNDHAWSMTLAELVLDTGRPVGEEWIEDGVQYISSAPYGLSAAGADALPEPGAQFMLYAPGATQKDTGADREFYWWLHQGPQANTRNWALHNLATDYGFLVG